MVLTKRKAFMTVDKDFFDNVFEPTRRSIQQELKLTNLSQREFTRMIKGFDLKIKRRRNGKRKKR